MLEFRINRARANPLSLEVWHLTLRFDLPGVGLAPQAERLLCSCLLDQKSTHPKAQGGGVEFIWNRTSAREGGVFRQSHLIINNAPHIYEI